jgi:hypothetical protein
MDLLNPTTLDLSIREDITRGIYVENLTEQPVSSTAEVPALGSVCSPPQMTVSSHVLSAIASGTRGSSCRRNQQTRRCDGLQRLL